MYPHERSLVRTLADKPFAIVGINSDKSPTIAKDVCVPKNISWRSFMNVQGDQKISDKWKVAGWPTTYLIDKDGVIRFKNLRGDKLDRAIEVLMAEKKKARTKKFRLRSNSFAIATIFQWCSAKSVGHHFFVNACSNVTSTWLRPLRVHVYAIRNRLILKSPLTKHAHGTFPKTHPTRKHANTQ